MASKFKTNNREVSWLQFNARVLQEAADARNPLFERIKFLAIYSSNLDEFFRVRVASLRSLLNLKKGSHKDLEVEPQKLLKKIQKIVGAQQESFGKIFQTRIIPELEKNKIFLVNETQLTESQSEAVRAYFSETVLPILEPSLLLFDYKELFLKNRSLYFLIELALRTDKAAEKEFLPKDLSPSYALLEIPTDKLPRFYMLPKQGNKTYVMFLDDVIRHSLKELFATYEVLGAYEVKLTRDAELHIEDEFQGDLLAKVKEGLSSRRRGIPSRFLYDPTMPGAMLKAFAKIFKLIDEDLIPGGRYHNFSDLMHFPNPGIPSLFDKPLPPLTHSDFKDASSVFKVMEEKDVLLMYPYQTYDYVLKFLQEAASDPSVIAVKIALYRVADNSKIVEILKEAVKAGKDVTAFVEIKARFDEERNLFWAGELERSGVRVLYSFPGLKVHSKMCIVTKMVNGEKKRYCYLGTGNFNEKTAKLYCDFGLFTTDVRITKEVKEVFQILGRKERSTDFDHLLVSPFTLRKSLIKYIDKEIKNVTEGGKGRIVLKLNSLEDEEMIQRLYEASNAGVKIQLIIRGICCSINGDADFSSNIRAISIVDRYLEHSRIYYFYNNGEERIYLSSADWMTRNLDHRIEVAFPIYDEKIREQLRMFIDLELRDNVKARYLQKGKMNHYRRSKPETEKIQSQIAIYKQLKTKHKEVKSDS
ncbi:MAG TPA: polyphosphate kinase 1 [Candidatus Kapabacteria bacterium]|nr:polyphosphate kinase 1 [Candidatus Kapabacteria bacterium]